MSTPTTPAGFRQYDYLPAAEAVAWAWIIPGAHERHHEYMQRGVRDQFPLLGRALDRMAVERLQLGLRTPSRAAADSVRHTWVALRDQQHEGATVAVYVRRWMPLLARALDRLAGQDRPKRADAAPARPHSSGASPSPSPGRSSDTTPLAQQPAPGHRPRTRLVGRPNPLRLPHHPKAPATMTTRTAASRLLGQLLHLGHELECVLTRIPGRVDGPAHHKLSCDLEISRPCRRLASAHRRTAEDTGQLVDDVLKLLRRVLVAILDDLPDLRDKAHDPYPRPLFELLVASGKLLCPSQKLTQPHEGRCRGLGPESVLGALDEAGQRLQQVQVGFVQQLLRLLRHGPPIGARQHESAPPCRDRIDVVLNIHASRLEVLELLLDLEEEVRSLAERVPQWPVVLRDAVEASGLKVAPTLLHRPALENAGQLARTVHVSPSLQSSHPIVASSDPCRCSRTQPLWITDQTQDATHSKDQP